MAGVPSRVLVLHGPNLARRAGLEINEPLAEAAVENSVELVIAQANGEEGLLDALWQEEDVDAVIVNAGVIAPKAEALREGLTEVGARVVEVQFTRRSSALTNVVEKTFVGQGAKPYLQAFAHFVGVSPSKKKSAKAAKSAPSKVEKTIARRSGAETTTRTAAVTRTLVREKFLARIGGKLTPAELMAWSKEKWTALQSGASVEAGAAELIEAALLAVVGGAASNDGALLIHVAKLDA